MRGSRNFRRGGGGGGQGQSNKKSSDNVFFSPQLILQKSNGQFQRNLSLSRFQRGSNFFQGGGGSNCLFPIETRIACDFPGGGGGGGGSGPPAPPSGSALGMQLVCTSKNIWAELFNEFGPSCLINLGRVGMGRVLCGPTWHGPSWFWAELSVILMTVLPSQY